MSMKVNGEKIEFKKLGKIHFTPLKFQDFFNFNPKISKLAIYPPEVSKSGNLNPPLTFSV
jgi:hypothetical protein